MLRYRNLTEMTKYQYKECRKELGYNVTDWCQALGISEDLHKSMCVGRRGVNPYILTHIQDLEELISLRIKYLLITGG